MDYLRFADTRRAACADFEARLQRARKHPRLLGYADLEGLTLAYRQLLHDQALAAARFPGTAIARRLQAAALAATHWLLRDESRRLPTVRALLLRTVPAAFRQLLPAIGITAALFVVAAVFGLGLTAVSPALANLFLGPEAIAGLRHGSLWTESIFAVTPGAVASTTIATNNLTVAITAWAGGALAGLGALWVVLLNGLMLGAVVAATMHYGMAGALGDFIAAHGPLEISLIVIAAAAGLDMGRALVVAGDRPRADLLAAAGRRGLTVLFACLPWIVVLGVVEGFVSPVTALPTAAKLALGLLLEVLFLTFAFNPWLDDVGGVAPGSREIAT